MIESVAARDAQGAMEARDAQEAMDTKIEVLSQDIANYLARYECKNLDLIVSPIDLLYTVDEIIEHYKCEIERLDLLVENLENSESEEIAKLRLRLGQCDALLEKVNTIPWLRDLIATIP